MDGSGGIRVLIVDDDAVTRRTLQRHLPFDSRTAGSVIEGLHVAQSWTPGLILLDVQMSSDEPGGLEALHLFRQSCPAAEVILMTSLYVEAAADEATREGAIYSSKEPGILFALAMATLACAKFLLVAGPWTLQ